MPSCCKITRPTSTWTYHTELLVNSILLRFPHILQLVATQYKNGHLVHPQYLIRRHQNPLAIVWTQDGTPGDLP